MDNMQLHWLVPAMLLSSDRLLDHALNPPESAVTEVDSQRKLYHMALRDYQSYLPGRLRKEDSDLALSQWTNIDHPVDYLSILNKLQQAFIHWRGDRFEVKHHQLETWLVLLSQVDPAWVIGEAYAELLDNGMLSVEQVTELARTQCPNALPKRFDGEPIADNHVHLGGNGHYSLSMASFALHLNKRPDQVTREEWPYRQEHSLFNSGACDLTSLPVMFHRLFGLLMRESGAEGNEDECESYHWDSLATHMIESHAAELKEFPAAGPVHRLLVAAIDESGPASWLLLTTAILLLLRRATTVRQTSMAQAFIQTASVLRNYMVVSGVGLGDFVKYFRFTYRMPVTGMNYSQHSQLHDLFDQHLREFRVTGDNYRYFAKAARVFLEQKLDTQIHFVYHFTREFSKKKGGDRRYKEGRNKSDKVVRKLQRFMGSVTFDSYPIMNRDFTDSRRVDLRAMLRGLDVAGNENELPIEVFAPALRTLRSATHHHKFPNEKRLRQPFITLHAGEDFGHILSGLRAVDEAVTFCDYQPGDRIGHGLALGIDVYKWAERQQHIYLPLQEHLDNLVWCYQHGLELVASHPQFQSSVMVIREKIHHFCYELYGQDFSPRILYQAWRLRRNCPMKLEKRDEALGTKWPLWVPDFDLIRHAQDENNSSSANESYQLWVKYLDRPRHDRDREQVVSIHYSRNGKIGARNLLSGQLEDVLSPAELELIHGIQDLMLERFSQSQWVLEACPTSNLYIGRLNSYDEHPIFRWSPPKRDELQPGGRANLFGIRSGSVRVCINTDDAGLMPTTLENEHRVLKDCAISSYGASDQDASLWIDSIRRTGVELFRSNHLNWAD
ncbi:hypothetical protein FM037_03385 [Shewanella psychropiezotolerans]|uniref:Adenosine deaminase n=1 Tax=Shewanella psychropiezotolerans TaxID=2593655 RepID=A0ABX5WTN2_9GAMM|nr:antiviral RADAR system adenosine deaminase RdrB [Shewanella psychropiezotolerans]QDO82460.1 hypothetical protein FM037_03385 [Shewanella psychropiezotolerans]